MDVLSLGICVLLSADREEKIAFLPGIRPLLNQFMPVPHTAFQAAKLNATAGQIKCARCENARQHLIKEEGMAVCP